MVVTDTAPTDDSPLDTPIQFIKGVGPRRAQLLERLGIRSIGDALRTFPFRYEDRHIIKRIADLIDGEWTTVSGKIIGTRLVPTRRPGFSILEAWVRDGGESVLIARWFNGQRLVDAIAKDVAVMLHGQVRRELAIGPSTMEHPEFELTGGDEDPLNLGRIIPVYRLTDGLSQRVMRGLMKRMVDEYADRLPDALPLEIASERGLLPLAAAVRAVHFPPDEAALDELNRGQTLAHRSLAYRECFIWQLALAVRRHRLRRQQRAAPVTPNLALIDQFISSLPFELTRAQTRVLEQIKQDLESPWPMNRLLQGDVGCGKTLVAVVAMLYAVTSGLQAALMVPTEVLAAQHARTLHRLLAPLGISSVLLTSSVTGSERRRTLERLADGSAQIAIGTHALIQKDVNFKALTMVVVDEQHRFGVLQRATLRTKGTTPDILIMTATPIPRTLGLTVFGDLDVSVIDELPPGRRPITTRVIFARQRDKLYQQIAHEAAAGRQIYIIYPLVEESESVDLQAATVAAEELRTNVFPGIRIGLLHGRMKHEEKQAVLQAFSAGQVPVLVSTTVIEVGIDVANATIMVIENAERFGMAQLHQLRGRVGRGVWPSYCYLVAGEKVTEMAKRRLKALEQSQDGFRIAEEDLAIRGPGEFLGTRQAGQVDGTLLAIIRHPDLLDLARNDAERLLQRVVEARKPLPDPLLVELRRAWRDRFALMTVG